MRLVCSDWSKTVCEIVRVLSWDPKSADGTADTSMEFILKLKRVEELRLNTSKADAAAPVILAQLDKLASLRSLHLDHTEASGCHEVCLIIFAELTHLCLFCFFRWAFCWRDAIPGGDLGAPWHTGAARQRWTTCLGSKIRASPTSASTGAPTSAAASSRSSCSLCRPV